MPKPNFEIIYYFVEGSLLISDRSAFNELSNRPDYTNNKTEYDFI